MPEVVLERLSAAAAAVAAAAETASYATISCIIQASKRSCERVESSWIPNRTTKKRNARFENDGNLAVSLCPRASLASSLSQSLSVSSVPYIRILTHPVLLPLYSERFRHALDKLGVVNVLRLGSEIVPLAKHAHHLRIVDRVP